MQVVAQVVAWVEAWEKGWEEVEVEVWVGKPVCRLIEVIRTKLQAGGEICQEEMEPDHREVAEQAWGEA